MFQNLKLVQLFVSIALLLTISGIASAQDGDNPHMVIDVDTGQIISGHRTNDRWHPASLTKLMTAWVTFQAIKAGEIEDGSPVVITAKAASQTGSRMGYKKGVTLRMDTALKIIIIKSANDVSQALAEAVAGSLEEFVSRMNAEAALLGMVNTNFTNANGLHDPKQVTSARDMALLSAKLLRDFPQYRYMFEAAGIKTPTKTHYSYNLLIERFAGTNGMKTGFVCASGYNMVASATRNNRTLIAVVLGRSSQEDRAVSAAKLLIDGFPRTGRSSVFLPVVKGVAPVDMRPVLCTEEARAQRYDPGAGQAVLDSPYLNPRKESQKLLEVVPGGVDADPSPAVLYRDFAKIDPVPVPELRPENNPVAEQVETPAVSENSNEAETVPFPTPSPRS